jgi:hypothetical protein
VPNGNLVYGRIKEINFFPTMFIILPENDPTTTERGRDMCAVVHHPSTKTPLDWTMKTAPDM